MTHSPSARRQGPLPGLVRASCIVLCGAVAGCGEPSRAAPPGASREADGGPAGRWHALEPGRELARARGLPLLVVVTQPTDTCPAAELLELRLGGEEALGDVCVPVRLDGHPERGQAERAFVARVCPDGLAPVLVVATPALKVLTRIRSGLYPWLDRTGSPLPEASGPLLDAQGARERVRAALAREREVDALLAGLAGRADPASALRRIGLLLERCQRAEAAASARTLAEEEPAPAWGPALADALIESGEAGEAARVLERLAERHPQDLRAPGWSVRALRLRLDEGRTPAPGRMAALLEAARDAGDDGAVALARGLEILMAARATEAMEAAPAHVLEGLAAALDASLAGEGAGAQLARDLVEAALKRRDYVDASRWADLLALHFPEHPYALRLRHGQRDCLRRAVLTGRLERPTRPPARPGAPTPRSGG